MDSNRMEFILKQLLEMNNQNRSSAENELTELQKQPEQFLTSLIGVVRNSTLSSVRNLACILIRQNVSTSEDGLWNQLSVECQTNFKLLLLQLLETEKELNIREKICQSIGELGLSSLENGTWPELLPCVFALCQSIDPATRLSGLSILTYLIPFLASTDKDDFPNLLVIYQHSLREHDHPHIQVEACRCVCILLRNIQTYETLQFINLIPLILRALGDMLNHSRVNFAREIIIALCDLVEVHPTFFKQNLESLIQAMISIARSNSIDDDTRHSALEFLTLLIEYSPVMIRALPANILIIPLLQILMSMLVKVEDDPNWAEEEDEPDENQDNIFSYALDVLNRVSLAIRSRVLLPSLYQILEVFLHNEDWHYRYAAIYSLIQVAEIVSDDSQKQQICDYILNSIQDEHVRVRYAAIRCIGQLATDFQPFLQNNYSLAVLNSLFKMVGEDQPVRIRYIATAAIINFVDGCSKEMLQPLLKDMITALMSPLLVSPVIVQQQIMFSIASIADCVGDLISPYYSSIMPIIKQLYIQPPIVIDNHTDPTIITTYRANALECITCVGVAVGGQTFKNDARDVLEVMYHEGMGEIDQDGSDMKVYMMSAWGRMCTALKEDFIPYLDMIIPILLKTVNQEVDMKTDEAISEYYETMMGDDDDEDDSSIIRTNAMNEKAIACRILTIIVVDLQSAMLPYLSSIINTLIPLLNTLRFQDIQMAVLVIMPNILKSLADSIYGPVGIENYKETFNLILDTLLTFIVDDPDFELLTPSLQTLQLVLEQSILDKNDIVEIIGGSEISRIIEILNDALKQSYERRVMRSADVEQEQWDEEEVEEFKDIENDENRANIKITEIIGTLLQMYPRFALPLVHEIMLNDLYQLADASRTAGDRLIGVKVMADIISYCGKEAYQYYPQFIPIFLREITCTDPQLRLEVMKVLSKAVAISKDLVCEIVPRCVKEIEQTLDNCIYQDSSFEESNEYSLVLLGTICLYLGNYLIMLKDHYIYWLQHLPLKNNELNMQCMKIICLLFERGEVALVGEANQNIPRILTILCESVGCSTDEELNNHIFQIIKSIQVQSDPALFNTLWNEIGTEKADFIKQRLAAVTSSI